MSGIFEEVSIWKMCEMNIGNYGSLTGIARFFYSGYRRLEVLSCFSSYFDFNSVDGKNWALTEMHAKIQTEKLIFDQHGNQTNHRAIPMPLGILECSNPYETA